MIMVYDVSKTTDNILLMIYGPQIASNPNQITFISIDNLSLTYLENISFFKTKIFLFYKGVKSSKKYLITIFLQECLIFIKIAT